MTDKSYHLFSSTDFLDDDDFIRYVKYGYQPDEIFWENWQKSMPDNIDSFHEAALQLRIIMSPPRIGIPDAFKENLLKDIHDSINRSEEDLHTRRSFKRLFGGLASLLIGAVFLGWYFLSSITVQAGYGKTLMLTLPDGSSVRLNSNSSLTYPRAFNWLTQREVFLRGEAYFKVKHLNQDANSIHYGDRFIAKIPTMTISVLGTEFNLKSRNRLSSIALVNGKVAVTTHRSGQTIIMKPGDIIELDEKGNTKPQSISVADQTAWLSGKIVIKQATVNDILSEFEDLYGYKVILDNPALGSKKIDGSISIKNEDNLLFTLKNILNVEVIKKGKTIYLKNR